MACVVAVGLFWGMRAFLVEAAEVMAATKKNTAEAELAKKLNTSHTEEPSTHRQLASGAFFYLARSHFRHSNTTPNNTQL